MEDTEFFEGVRAKLIEKDHKPNFRYQYIGEITQKEIDEYFEELPKTVPELGI